MEGDRYVEANPYFEVQPVVSTAIVPEGLAAISHNAVNEQISKANKRIAAGDFAGAAETSAGEGAGPAEEEGVAIWPYAAVDFEATSTSEEVAGTAVAVVVSLRAATELELLPEGSAIVEMLGDCAVMREQVRGCDLRGSRQ